MQPPVPPGQYKVPQLCAWPPALASRQPDEERCQLLYEFLFSDDGSSWYRSASKGNAVTGPMPPLSMACNAIIWECDNEFYRAASEMRKDGQATGW